MEPDTPVPDALPCPAPPNSRRDFLRRAGKQAAKDAVEIGSKIVPGAGLAKRFLQEQRGKRDNAHDPDDDLPALDLNSPLGDGAGADVPPPAPSVFANPLGWLAAWRKRREP